MPSSRVPVAVLLIGLFAAPLGAQDPWPGRSPTAPVCTGAPSGTSAQAWLARARRATGLTSLDRQVLRYGAVDVFPQLIQSDRVYPPYLLQTQTAEWWFDPMSGAEYWGAAGSRGARGMIRDDRATFQVQDSVRTPSPAAHRIFDVTRPLNPLAVLSDWATAGDAIVDGQCAFREYPRIVLRSASRGERLWIDPKSALPVRLEREEGHFLLGQVAAEYLYQTWWQIGPVVLPVTATRLIDGVEEASRVVARNRSPVVSADSARWLRLPSDAADMRAATHPMLDPAMPDTIRIGPQSFLLANRAYSHAVTLARDTVFLFDATIGEGRSRQDSTWIARLFPGRHPVVLVVTDLAWPHIAGVRFWVARGATIVTHPLSRPFLEQVIARRWTRDPDALELARALAPVAPRFRLTDRRLRLAGGAVEVAPIDGVGSEGALMAWVPGDGFLWAGDYIQSVRQPSLYSTEVWRAARREGIFPVRTAAQHLPLTPWSAVTSVADTIPPS